MPNCGVCQGIGKQTLRSIEITPEGREEAELEMDCVWCHGSGQMTEVELERLQQYKEMWCQCGNPSRKAYYLADGVHPKLHKHHWRCADCNKVLQIG